MIHPCCWNLHRVPDRDVQLQNDLQDLLGHLKLKIKSILKEVAFIAGKSENQAAKIFFIRFFIDNLIANISLYALSWPKLNFGCYLTFEIIFKL